MIEGWQQLELKDKIIDRLLVSKNVILLKRYWNGVFHYQKTYFDKRFSDFMTKGENAVE